jgi:hypothetical protein
MKSYVLMHNKLILGRSSYLVSEAIEPGEGTEITIDGWYTLEVGCLPYLTFLSCPRPVCCFPPLNCALHRTSSTSGSRTFPRIPFWSLTVAFNLLFLFPSILVIYLFLLPQMKIVMTDVESVANRPRFGCYSPARTDSAI